MRGGRAAKSGCSQWASRRRQKSQEAAEDEQKGQEAVEDEGAAAAAIFEMLPLSRSAG